MYGRHDGRCLISVALQTLSDRKTLNILVFSPLLSINHFQNLLSNGELRSQRRRLGGREAGDVSSVEREKKRDDE